MGAVASAREGRDLGLARRHAAPKSQVASVGPMRARRPSVPPKLAAVPTLTRLILRASTLCSAVRSGGGMTGTPSKLVERRTHLQSELPAEGAWNPAVSSSQPKGSGMWNFSPNGWVRQDR